MGETRERGSRADERTRVERCGHPVRATGISDASINEILKGPSD